MWTNLHGDMKIEKAEILVLKSRQAPLYIECNRLEAAFWELIKPHFHRWKSFECETTTSTLKNAVEFFRTHPAPLLKKFMCPNGCVTPEPSSPLLFNNYAPQLQCLSFRSFSFPYDSPILSNLTILDIPAPRYLHYEEHESAYMKLLSSLSPALECLSINGDYDSSFITPPSHWTPFETKFHFPQLTILQLDDLSCYIVGLFLSSIRSSETVMVVIDEVNITGDRLDPFDVMLQSRPTGPNIFTLAMLQTETLKIHHNGVAFHFSGECSVPFTFDGEIIQENDRCSIDIDFDDIVSSAGTLYTTISNSHCLGNVSRMVFDGRCFFKDTGSINLLHQMENLENLELVSCTANIEHFFAVLSHANPNKSGGSHRPCKKLKTILLENIPRQEFGVESLIGFWNTRYPQVTEGGDDVMPLNNLKIKRWYLSEDEASLLREAVGNCTLEI
ncbi:hypothetical protein FRC03_011315 [Tulasnella sp. 419]|nr:hypothetical protein FRC03_011315 [Tulasnella sp. 419]